MTKKNKETLLVYLGMMLGNVAFTLLMIALGVPFTFLLMMLGVVASIVFGIGLAYIGTMETEE